MKSSFHASMYEKGIFLYLLYGAFYYFKDTVINWIHQKKTGESFLKVYSLILNTIHKNHTGPQYVNILGVT